MLQNLHLLSVNSIKASELVFNHLLRFTFYPPISWRETATWVVSRVEVQKFEIPTNGGGQETDDQFVTHQPNQLE